MKTIEVNKKVYKVRIADTEEDRERGLQGVETLDNDEGMLFIFDEEDEVSFWMKDTPINLDIIFMDEDWEIVKVATGYADQEKAHTAENVMYVLEVKQGSGIRVGDDVDLSNIEDDVDELEDSKVEDSDTVMSVLDSDGSSQMDLKGGERIFSRKHTKVLARLAKRAHKSKSEKDYKTLGRKVFNYLRIQNEKDDDYVDLPEN